MKALAWRGLLVALLLASVPARAWFFFFIPGKAIDAIGDAITGSEGSNCVGPNAKVGDLIRLNNGTMGKVKSLSGTSSRCTQPEHPIRALIEATNETAPSAAVDTRIGINLPDGWESKDLTDQQRASGMVFNALNRTLDVGMNMFVAKRQGITDMVAYTNTRMANQAGRLTDAAKSEIQPITINGLPAWRFNVVGQFRSNRYAYLVTVIDANPEIILLNTWTTEAAFDVQRPTMEKIAEGLKGFTPAAQPPTTTAQAPAPAPVDAVPSPAVSTPPVAPAPTTVASPTPAPGTNPVVAPAAQRLRELSTMLKEGLITQQDYDERKKRILDSL